MGVDPLLPLPLFKFFREGDTGLVRYVVLAAALMSCAVTQEVIVTPQERVTQELENKNYLRVIEILESKEKTESEDYLFARSGV
jgi:hypothetical protein